MEILSKVIRERKDRYCISVQVPDYMVEHLGIELGDMVRVKSNGTGLFCLEKSPDNLGVMLRENNRITFPNLLREKFRITSKHSAMFFIHRGKVCFKFTK